MIKKDKDRLKRMFPTYFELFDLPEGAREENITVYRACKTWRCDKESFTPTFEEQGYQYLEGDDPKDPGLYSLSTAEKPKDIKRFVKFNSEYRKPYKIAIGKTDTSCGLVQRTREREKKRKDSHVDWWLYEKSEPYKFFEMIDDFESYYEEYKKR